MSKTRLYSDEKKTWEFTLKDGEQVKVEYSLNFLNHLAFYGPVSSTRYWSTFTLETIALDETGQFQNVDYRLEDVKEYAERLAEFLHEHKDHDLSDRKYRDLGWPARPEPLPLDPVFVERQGNLFEDTTTLTAMTKCHDLTQEDES